MYIFKKTPSNLDHPSIIQDDVEIEFRLESNDRSISDIKREFANFLLACGYCFDKEEFIGDE